MQLDNTFPKSERLCGEIRIAKLFSEGKAFIVYPFRIVYSTTDEQNKAAVRVLISVSKKRFKKATDRNRIKRQMREIYRLNKHQLYTQCVEKDINLILAISYIADKQSDFKTMSQKMISALSKVSEKLNQ